MKCSSTLLKMEMKGRQDTSDSSARKSETDVDDQIVDVSTDANIQTLETAQRAFKDAVTEELEKLQNKGEPRSVAVQILLKRIAGKLVKPKTEDVNRVVERYGLPEEDAVRALIVKEELRRLKRGGLDGLAAVEELTRKMRKFSDSSSLDASKSINDNLKCRVQGQNSLRLTTGVTNSPKGSRKRCLGDESVSAAVLKRLRRFAMKDNTSSSTKEQNEAIPEISAASTTKQHSSPQQQTNPVSKKRNLKSIGTAQGATSSGNKRCRKKH